MKNKPRPRKEVNSEVEHWLNININLLDKIAKGTSMFLSGPLPNFAMLALKVAGQASGSKRFQRQCESLKQDNMEVHC